MKAILSRSPGGPETLVLGELPDPAPNPGQVVVGVEVCSVNYPDVLVIQDLYQYKPKRPFAPGAEISGVVLACGQGVTSLKIGDRVMGFGISGGMAEKIALPAHVCAPLVDSMPFEDAAALTLTYGTAYHALRDRANLRKGETLLVLGAGSGVGLAAVEIGKAAGARVIAAASSSAKVEIAMQRGADKGVVYPRVVEDARAVTESFKEACGPDGADVIYDPVGGVYSEAALRAIARYGRFLVVGFPAGIAKISLNLPLLKNCQIVGVFFGDFSQHEPAAYQENNRQLMALYQQGAIKPLISARFPLARAAEAIDCLAKRTAIGKIIVTIR
ncbi:MAG: NADPH:quinone oxidoreductase family protein [Rhodospirillaceae bacterium]|nr:MAG: NADPH:quinone oxidoreductase family protein [Rhodospirillaceae bacterium]